MLAKRMNRVKPSPTLAVSGKAKAMKAEGLDVVDFSVGEPDFPTPNAIKEAGIQAIRDNHTTYTAGPGTPALRKAICAKLKRDHGLDYAPEEIIVCTGAKQALYNTAMVLFDEGDEVLIPSPCWVSYVPQVALADATAVCVETGADSGFKITPEQLKAAITPKTKAFMLNNPSNPTGGAYTRDELAALAEVLSGTDIWVIADEIYEKLVYDNFKFTSFPSIDPIWKNRTILINGVSKAYAMTGWRIGYAAAPVQLIKAMSKIQGHSTSNANSIAQEAAIAALTGPEDEIEQMRIAFEERRNLMHQLMTALPDVTCFKPQGAFYLFADFSNYLGRSAGDTKINTCVDLADFILAEAHTAVVPGVGFEVAKGYLRFSYASSPERIREGMSRVAAALEKLS
jgi:aspartate aminotransferase